MQMKRIIISADDFGYSTENNNAVLIGYKEGNITAAGLMANMDGFNHAVEAVIPQIPDIDLGFHFNIIEGMSLTKPDLLCNTDGHFNCNFLKLMFNQNNPQLLSQIEIEFKAQIEKILNYYPVSHIDSHVHIHAIPSIFNLVVKLAKEYDIEYVRTQREIPYIVRNKILNSKFPVNIIKNVLLNSLSQNNVKNLSGIKTNDYIIGVLYTGGMEEETVYNGLKKINREDSLTEVLFHPHLPADISNSKRMNNYREFLITKTPNFRKNLEEMGFLPVSFCNIAKRVCEKSQN